MPNKVKGEKVKARIHYAASADRLRRRVRRGMLEAGITSLEELALAAGVGIGSVSRVLSASKVLRSYDPRRTTMLRKLERALRKPVGYLAPPLPSLPPDARLHERLRAQRETLGLSQEALAQLIGVSQTAISHAEQRAGYVDDKPWLSALMAALHL